MVKIIVIALAVIVGVAAVAYFTQPGPSVADLPPAQPIDPPAGATVLPDEVRPGDVIRGVIAARNPDDAEAAAADWIDTWVPARGWRGAVKRVEIRPSSTWFSIEMFDSTIIGNQFYVYVEVTGGAPQVQPGVEVIVRGRIKSIRGTPDAGMVPAGISLDQATIIHPPLPR